MGFRFQALVSTSRVLRSRKGKGLIAPRGSPAGTRIIYDRKFLLECKNSPVARTPPCYLPHIPGITSPPHAALSKLEDLKEQNETEEEVPDDNQFAMDI
uniref:Eukaryotic translation initiation factor 4E binding protein 3 n=1 Tax=Chelonoidis abingdonii TaxID=106734 RepID=A0A8C0J242_CHEAB